MKKVKIVTKKLLKHLEVNRKKHIDSYQDMMDTYRKALVMELEEKLSLAKQQVDVDHRIKLERPVSYLSSYDQAIEMLKWTTELEVELDVSEFRQYVQDEWNWKGHFAGTETFYNEVKTGFSSKR